MIKKLVNTQYNLFGFLRKLHDPRRTQGQRFALYSILAITIMAILSGETGLRGFTRFAKSNESELVKTFSCKHGGPTFGTFRIILLSVNPIELAQHFKTWMSAYVELDDTFALDGKTLRSTVTHLNEALHDFVNITSLFGHKNGLVTAIKSFRIKETQEAEALRPLIASLGIKEVTFTMDAVHTQKNT